LEREIARLRDCLSAVPRPLNFIGQIDLSEAGEAAGDADLPSDGILYFFVDADLLNPTDSTCWRVVYVRNSKENLECRKTPAGCKSFNRLVVIATAGLSASSATLRSAAADAAVYGGTRGLYYLGGGLSDPDWCRPRIQRSRTSIALSNPVTAEEWTEITKESKCLRQLLHLETGFRKDGPGWMWGDVGALTFWLSDDDWKAGRFDRSLAYLDTT
jgi:hypothetical protein